MDPVTAKQRLTLMVAATTDPVLGDDEVAVLLDLARRPDLDGRAPSDPGWVPTFALGAAAAEGWRWKAGRVSDRVDLVGDDTNLRRSQTHEHCMIMAARYDRAAWGTTPLAAPVAGGGSPFALPGARERGDNTW